ncbi:speckle-type POZ protein B [Caerostris extrusa]|uniref:Speckle-type POZ protein B n=1 Tax=Caerostris extrusa TaxID=172846 RepID=A0AAV4XTC5_CAEEX|nr:speckle-type POZ protein B [Caerostris extrusa]
MRIAYVTLQGNIVIEVPVDFENVKLSICKILILDSSNKWEEFGICQDFKKPGEVFSFVLLVDNKNIDFWKKKYIPNGRLTLKCVISFTTKDEPDRFEAVKYGYGIPQKNIERPNACIKKAQTSSAFEERKGLPRTFKDEITSLYKEGILCDTHLRTETESFPAHKAVLSARSAVFKTMFSTDMREKIKNTSTFRI